MKKNRPKNIVITLGDPSGCGPEVTFRAVKALSKKKVNFWVVGDKYIAEQIPEYQKVKKRIFFLEAGTKNIDKIKRGFISKLTGQASLVYLKKALKTIEEKKFSCLVTAPVSKEAISLSKPKFSGHTEFLRDYFNSKRVVMMMVSEKIKTVLLTRHIDLKNVAASIDKEVVLDTIKLTYSFLKKQLNIANPVIGLASINPHAGIDTFMKKEEEIIKKAVEQSKNSVYGPYPADSLFNKNNLKKFDCIIASYHDQGMIPFKLLSFRSGVNLTLGLPIVRTSPDHGVAYDLVKRNSQAIFSSSMQAAISQAIKLSS
ncbi:MAG: 4-hydroxythreonine-4-phosphate dehydrogenase PdxA [Candidatus Omnitrophica bacterium]|nr:4-hydroxythreonine-4-phosphate dehydrogenase PdxA [Candidatus Omnitrophota bacterium]MCF7878369.1 4-hydroxythreonine-4-phosphate dehydrogenase PdxA [Candidatus Omnitrophota bacterium]MCF7892827.1 4-hydroxythreonine-4-phosphate dehydrogenase PdxA [Candidatus Omnitrophota bacterium]